MNGNKVMSIKKGKNVIIEDGVVIGKNVTLGDNVYIERGCILRDNICLGEGTFVGANSILGEHLAGFYKDRQAFEQPMLYIGKETIIRSYAIIYGGVTIGDFFQTGHRVTIRENTTIGHHVRIGTNSDIQDGVEIGNHVNIHSDVFISAGNKICDYAWICPRVLFANDFTPPSNVIKGSRVESFSTVGSNTTVLPGTHIQKNVLIAAGAVIGGDTEEGLAYAGVPAKKMKSVTKIKNKITGENAYPWPQYFNRGMPWEESSFEEWSNK